MRDRNGGFPTGGAVGCHAPIAGKPGGGTARHGSPFQTPAEERAQQIPERARPQTESLAFDRF
ncbi:MAG: hypothetical protein CMJ59_14425 [Planctomycetaceae bacterium]|nr:hypothetical protein [Planctomycetaceae bacterium]